jgi:hypothetical protein
MRALMTSWVTQPTTPVQVLVPLLRIDQSDNEPPLKLQTVAKACPIRCVSLKQMTKTALSETERH